MKKLVKYIILIAFTVWAINGIYTGVDHFWYPRSEPLSTLNNQTRVPFKAVQAIVSFYSKAETCPDRECITASGSIAKAGNTIACPREIPLGTVVDLQGSRYICSDRTHYRFNGRYDVFTGDTEQAWVMAKNYGLQKHLIKIYR